MFLVRGKKEKKTHASFRAPGSCFVANISAIRDPRAVKQEKVTSLAVDST